MPLRCLIVDDNSEFLAAAKTYLEKQGVEVVGTAQSGAEALETTTALRPDVVLVDVYLGDESGFDVARHLDGSLADGRPAIILISTYSEADLGERVEASGAAGFLSKTELSGRALSALLGLDTP